MTKKILKISFLVIALLFTLPFNFVMAHSSTEMSEMSMVFTLHITKDNAPLVGADVLLSSQSRTSDSTGTVQFDNISEGTQSVKILYNNRAYDETLDIHSDTATVNVTGNGQEYSLNSLSNSTLVSGVSTSSAVSNSSTATGGLPSFVVILVIVIALLITASTVFIVLMYRKKQKFNFLGGNKKLGFIVGSIGMVVVLGVILAQSAFVTDVGRIFNVADNAKAAVISSVPSPTNLTIEEDDRVATLGWTTPAADGDARANFGYYDVEGFAKNPDVDAGIRGYLVEWGKTSAGFVNKQISLYREFQLQPLENGVPYQVKVSSIDANGNLSNASPTINFTGKSTRVDALRSKMNGFFDDFNLPAGPFDETKWNNAYSACVVPGTGGQFINSQYHAHSQLYSALCDRGQNHSRARQLLDFSDNGTRTIAFDLDGALKRDQWYLDFNDASLGNIDLTGHVDLEDIGNPQASSYPAHTLRIHQNGDKVHIFYFDNNGVEQETTRITSDPCGETGLLDCAGRPLTVINNVRRHWEIKMSKSKVEVRINGVLVNDARINLPYSKATVDWIAFSYNTPKASEKAVLMHWDNFGFDAPSGFTPTITHSYLDGLLGTEGGKSSASDPSSYDVPVTYTDSPITRKITIPAGEIGSPTARRLQFSLQKAGGGGAFDYVDDWKSSDHVEINGVSIPVPKPSGVGRELVSPYHPYPVILNLPANALKEGDNMVKFVLSTVTVFNVHIEMDYSSGNVPKYSQPKDIYGSAWVNKIIPPMSEIGPSTVIHTVGNKSVDFSGTSDENLGSIGNFSGQVNIKSSATNINAMIGMGKEYGIRRTEVVVDRSIVNDSIVSLDSSKTPPSFAVFQYNLDTTKLCNGKHEIYTRAYNLNGVDSNTEYFQGADVVTTFTPDGKPIISSGYYPVYINVNNGNAPQTNINGLPCSGKFIPNALPQPALNPFGTPTATATPLPPQNTPTPTPVVPTTAIVVPTSTIPPVITTVAPSISTTIKPSISIVPSISGVPVSISVSPTAKISTTPVSSPTPDISRIPVATNTPTPMPTFTPTNSPVPTNVFNTTSVVNPTSTPRITATILDTKTVTGFPRTIVPITEVIQVDTTVSVTPKVNTPNPVIQGNNPTASTIEVDNSNVQIPVVPNPTTGNWTHKVVEKLSTGSHVVKVRDQTGNVLSAKAFDVEPAPDLPNTGSTSDLVFASVSAVLLITAAVLIFRFYRSGKTIR